ncbi:hypothetical protein BDN70DRAFT_690202 [Pholiota conissans]|uniref:Uncharacterized protein n=1 Tax=Pholiota conissans TaxID=109636 RepID=A0A9P5Z262_9AGAR|nr:hypothetical protein BDN70DRAFT_690202 [Pholiota conissans]
MLICLLVIEIGLLLAQIILHTKYGSTTVSFALAALFNRLLAAAYFITASTTIVTTTLIAYRIYSVTKQEGVSADRFKQVTDIVIQSGAVNSLTLLSLAIIIIVNGGFHSITDTRSFAAVNYMWSILSILGISTTILVARVALLADETTLLSSSIHLSGLQFYMRSTHCTATQDADIIEAGQPSGSGVIGEGEKAKQKRGSSV